MDTIINFAQTLFFYFTEYVMHFDRYMPVIMENYGSLIYFLLFAIIFCETGLVVTPFLPGDSLLFACGALAATAGGLHLPTLVIICLTAAILGDACNYMIGEKLGHELIARHNRLIKAEHIEKAQHFYEKHGHKAIFLARFVPIVRTFAPFVAGIGNMHYRTFATYNIVGAVVWVGLFITTGYFFGNMPFVKNYFSHVTLGIIVFSVLPIVFEIIKARRKSN
ncbi:MAG: DedA family protein [Acholeplasmataceae bacterium]|nr:DedA family protein [Acholeplasmataceae bacterium]